jgi:hypothetical protein
MVILFLSKVSVPPAQKRTQKPDRLGSVEGTVLTRHTVVMFDGGISFVLTVWVADSGT